MRSLLVALALSGCVIQPEPVTPPAEGPGSCETAEQTARRLGGCGLHLETYAADCAAKVEAYEEVDMTFPVGCFTASSSCAEYLACRSPR